VALEPKDLEVLLEALAREDSQVQEAVRDHKDSEEVPDLADRSEDLEILVCESLCSVPVLKFNLFIHSTVTLRSLHS